MFTSALCLTGLGSVLNLYTLELKQLLVLTFFSELSSFAYAGSYEPGPALVGIISNADNLYEELLNGAEC